MVEVAVKYATVGEVEADKSCSVGIEPALAERSLARALSLFTAKVPVMLDKVEVASQVGTPAEPKHSRPFLRWWWKSCPIRCQAKSCLSASCSSPFRQRRLTGLRKPTKHRKPFEQVRLKMRSQCLCFRIDFRLKFRSIIPTAPFQAKNWWR